MKVVFRHFIFQVIDVYEPPQHLVLHHNRVSEGLTGALVGVVTLKDPQLSHLSIQLLYDPDSAFEVKDSTEFHLRLVFSSAARTTRT